MAEDFEVLSAVLDSEVVDIETLARALDDPDGRLFFVHSVELRQLGAGADSGPSPDFYRRASANGLTKPLRRGSRRIPLPLAAAAVLVALLFGSLLNLDSLGRDSGPTAPPEPTRVLRFERGVDWR